MTNAAPVVVMLLPASDYDPTESAVIWDALTTSGIEVRFATPDGEPAYADSRLVDKGFSVLSPQAEVTAALASPDDFEAGPRVTLRDSPNHLSRGFTVKDGNYLSARWPGDCYRLAADYVDMVCTAFRLGR